MLLQFRRRSPSPLHGLYYRRSAGNFFELHPSSRSQGTFLFFDEIQEVPNWDIAARRIVDTEKITMYVTGSSSRMLSTDVATEFRGRSIAYELLPFSFREYARYHHVLEDQQGMFDKEQQSLLKRACRDYLVQGGFPGVQMLDDNACCKAMRSSQLLAMSLSATVFRTRRLRETWQESRLLQADAISPSAR